MIKHLVLCIFGTLLFISCSEEPTENIPSGGNGTVAPCPGLADITYEGQTYNTVKIGDQCWLKENLNVGVKVTRNSVDDNLTDNGIMEKFCYENSDDNCGTYGGLYQWDEIMLYETTEGAEGFCPTGWHIPTKAEFETLINAVGDDGNALKALGQGSGGGSGKNTSGFSALLAGHRDHNDGLSHGLGGDAIFWSSTATGINAYTLDLSAGGGSVVIRNYDQTHGFSVRCIKD